MFIERNQIHNFMSCSGSGTVINYGSGSGSDFLTSYGSYGSGSGSTTLVVFVHLYGIWYCHPDPRFILWDGIRIQAFSKWY